MARHEGHSEFLGGTCNNRTMSTTTTIPAHLPQLASQTSPEHPWPLHLLSAKIEEYVAKMSRIWVEGEVITYNPRPGAKIQYFTLSDLDAATNAKIQVKIFTHNIRVPLESGSRVIVCAKPEFWAGNGSLSLMADDIRLMGLGELLARIEALKQQLAAEGLFDPERKRPLPFLPKKIGLICGRNTDAKRDVLVNVQKRWAAVEFAVREVQVQGSGAVSAMLGALRELESDADVEVIVFARGGGSIEDLLPFSDESLLRAVAACTTPVVSAIGHEADTPLLDFVADVRASTPTDVARRVVPAVDEERNGVANALERGRAAIGAQLAAAQQQLANLLDRPVLTHPETIIDARNDDLVQLRSALRLQFGQTLNLEQSQLLAETRRLRTLSPQATLERGYSVIRNPKGHIVTTPSQALPGASLEALLAGGKLTLQVPIITKEAKQ